MNFIETLGFKVFSDLLSNINLENESPKILNTISPNSYGISTKDEKFRLALKETDYLVLDGVYFALSSILLHGKNIKKNQGPNVFYHFMERMNQTNGKVFFLGASQQTLGKMKTKAATDYPNVSVGYYSPPYKPEFSKEDTWQMIDTVNLFAPDILFIGMTCPKQEKWAYQNKEKLNAKLICCIGGVFDWFAGNYKEIPKIWWTLRLGWFVRAIQRPELLKRNIPYYYIFAKDVVKQFFGRR